MTRFSQAVVTRFIKAVVTLFGKSGVALFSKGVMTKRVDYLFNKRGVTLSRVSAGTRTRPRQLSTRSISKHSLLISRVG